MTRLVIIGGDAAGMSAAARAHRLDPTIEIVAFERGAHTSYAAAGLPYLVAGLVPDADRLVVRTPDQHRAKGIDVRTGHEVTRIDPDTRTVTATDQATGHQSSEHFDHLVIATGADPVIPPLPGIEASGVFTINSIPDAQAIDTFLAERAPRRAVVVGAGYTGLEMVEVLLSRELGVDLVERAAQPMPKLDPDMGAHIATALATQGASLHLSTSVEGFTTDQSGLVTSVLTDRGELACDLVILCLGVRPATDIASDAGITIGATGAIATNARRRTNIDGIWAVGDCSESYHRVSQRDVWIGLGTHANKHGRVAGENIAGGSARFEGVIGTAITKAGDLEVACTGLNEHDATKAGFDVATTTVTGDTRADYYPDAAKMTVKLVTQAHSGRLLGAQIVGGPESGKRIDALAVAVWNEMTVGEYAQLDLSYAPPYAPVWETSLIAARMAGR